MASFKGYDNLFSKKQKNSKNDNCIITVNAVYKKRIQFTSYLISTTNSENTKTPSYNRYDLLSLPYFLPHTRVCVWTETQLLNQAKTKHARDKKA